MKSKIKEATEVQKQEYPCLKVFRKSLHDENLEKVVLFIAPNEGFLVHFSFCDATIGDFCADWNEPVFEPFYGTVELSN